MALVTKTAQSIYAPVNDNGQPRAPSLQEAQLWGTEVEALIGITANAAFVFDTRANLYATLTAAANTLAWVVADSTTAYNGIYRKSGASGSGFWTRVADLPYSFVLLTDVGAGTANAIQLTSAIPTSASVMRIANVYEANTGNVTISENGAAAKSLLTNSGNQIVPGGLTAGAMIVYVDNGATYRLLSDQASAAIVPAAEAAAQRAEEAAASLNLPAILPGDAGKTLSVKPDETGYIFVPALPAVSTGDSGKSLLVKGDETGFELGFVAKERIYDTLSAAQSASPKEDVLAFWTLGRNAPGDGGLGFWVYNMTPVTAAFITCANGRKYELSVNVANVKIFGAMGKNDGDNSDGFRQAIAYAKIKKVPVYAPAGIYQIHSSCTVDFSEFTFFGDGSLTKIRGVDTTTEVFRLDCGTGVLNYIQMHDFAIEAYFSGGGVAASGAAINVVGSAAAFVGIGQCQFFNIQSRGWPVFLASNAPTHATGFGNEGPVNWCRFHNIDFGSFSRQHLYGFIFNTGSGTGNKFSRLGGVIDKSVFLYQGSGLNPVVGDILIEDMEHWSSANTTDSTILTIGANTSYRSRITIRGGQLDAGFSRVLSLASGGAGYSNIIVDVAMGGAAVMGTYPSLATSRLNPALGTVSAS